MAAGGAVDRDQARKFFEDNFKPVRILPGVHTYGFYTGADGFFTGYYEAEVAGSRTPTDEFKVPIYSPPKNLIGKKSTVFSNFDRKEIEDGAIAGKGLEICYVKDPVDAFFAQSRGLHARQARGRRAAAAQLHRQQRQALYAGWPTPIWVEAEFPIKGLAPVDPFHHLMFAQDTGSAIKGPARADIIFGHGEDIPHIAGRIKQFGKFVMLVPKDVSVSGTDAPAAIPLPRPRPQEISIHEAMAKGKEAKPAAPPRPSRRNRRRP